MRVLAAISFALLVTATSVSAQGDDVIKPISLKLTASGEAALAASKPVEAAEDFETALAVDPRNRMAFIGLARAAQQQGLTGKAVKYYREALQIEPNDLVALEGQGQALVARGARARAQANLDRIKLLCKGDCAPAKRLQTAISAAPAQTVAAALPTSSSAKN